jgi:epoxyqueuosine reductase QueG
VQTDMPLVPDKPVDLGVETFCKACVKCAVSCPSRSIPTRKEKRVDRGIRRWKLNEETCFDYWGKVGTDCSVCMAVCPFSRPNRGVHRLTRSILRRSHLARVILPRVEQWVYGKRWSPRKGPGWVSYEP